MWNSITFNDFVAHFSITLCWVSFTHLGQNKHTHLISVTNCWFTFLNMYKPILEFIQRCTLLQRYITRLVPNGIPLIPSSYLSSEKKCLRRSVSSAVWDGIRPDFSIYPPPSPSSTSLTPLISCSHFMMTGNPAGLEGRHLSSHSQEGIFQSNMWRLWFKCTSKELRPSHRLSFSIADKDNECEVSEPSNVRQSLSSGSLL